MNIGVGGKWTMMNKEEEVEHWMEPSEDYGSWFAQYFVQSWEECTSEPSPPFTFDTYVPFQPVVQLFQLSY
jgi:hypothetical protein